MGSRWLETIFYHKYNEISNINYILFKNSFGYLQSNVEQEIAFQLNKIIQLQHACVSIRQILSEMKFNLRC